MNRQLGQLGTQLFAYTQMRKLSVLRTGDLSAALRITAKQERELLGRMARGGLIAQVQRGLYLVPPRLPLGGKWSPDEILALNTLMDAHGGRYQICGPAAFNRFGFDEQVPSRLHVYNNRLSGDRQIGAVALTFIKVADARLGATEEFRAANGSKAVYSSRVRTLVDAVYDWSRFASLPRAYAWIRCELKTKRVTAEELVKVTLRYGNQETMRRMGVLLEQERVSKKLLQRLQKALKPSTRLIPWVPGASNRGKVERQWGVVVHEPK